MNVVASESSGIAAAIPPFVMLPDRQYPVAEPVGQRLNGFETAPWVLAQDFPLGLGGAPILVEYVDRNIQFADIVKEGSPAQMIGVDLGESELSCNQVGVGSDPLTMASGEAIVVVEGGDQAEQPLAVGDFLSPITRCDELVDAPAELTCRSGSNRFSVAGRSFTREKQAEVQQCCDREESASKSFGGEHRRGPDG